MNSILQPITHFTQANLLTITNNETGAIYHYEKALELDSTYTEALDKLRNLKCVKKYQADDNNSPVKVSVELTFSKMVKVDVSFLVLLFLIQHVDIIAVF